jgi:hypothetical protein
MCIVHAQKDSMNMQYPSFDMWKGISEPYQNLQGGVFLTLKTT